MVCVKCDVCGRQIYCLDNKKNEKTAKYSDAKIDICDECFKVARQAVYTKDGESVMYKIILADVCHTANAQPHIKKTLIAWNEQEKREIIERIKREETPTDAGGWGTVVMVGKYIPIENFTIHL